MIDEVQIPMGKVGTTLAGESFDQDHEYAYLEVILHDHDSWISKKSGNKGHTPEAGSEWWQRSTNGGKHAYTEGESAKQKGNTAQQQGALAAERGAAAAAMAAYARLMGDNPPRVGKSLPNGDPNDNFWYYFVPNETLDGGSYVKSNVYAKGDDLSWDDMTQEEREALASLILDTLTVQDVSSETIIGWINSVQD